MSRYPRRRRPVRLLTAPWTLDDMTIVEHLPSWLRADYKLSDRFDAETSFTWEKERSDGQVINQSMETQGSPVSSSRSDGSSEPLPAAPTP